MPFFPIEALAQGAQAAPAGDSLSQLLPTLLPMIAIFGVFYFLMIRPQQKRQREHLEMLKKIKKGDKVVTSAGIHGTVSDVSDEEPTVAIKVADNTTIRFDKNVITVVQQ
ncbi:MAG: preprotein translocase subunit YajC [Bacteroidota bacterium]|jgi:preprotein translocase subunit YajC